MKQQAPRRWSDELGSDAPEGMRAMLAAARDDGPSAAQLERLVANVSSPVPPAPASMSTLPLVLKVGVFALLLAGIGAWHRLSVRTPEPQAAPLATPAAPPPLDVAPAPETAGPAPEVPVVEPAAPARAAKPKEPRANEAPQRPSRASDDIALLQRAKRSLPASPARALELLATHARDFPESAFTEEREALAVEAQLGAGRRDRARAQLELFKARYPRSAYLRRLEGLSFTGSTRK